MFKKLIGFLMFLLSTNIFAQEKISAGHDSVKMDIVQQLIEVGGTLVLVIVAIFVCIWVMRYFMRGNFLKASNMKIIGNLPLSAKEKLLLVKVDNLRILLGVSSGGIQGLHVFEDSLQANSDEVKENKLSNSFFEKMQEALNKNGKN